MVIDGVLAGNCTDLRFYEVSASQTPSADITYRALFL
jgi:hypothetical protein